MQVGRLAGKLRLVASWKLEGGEADIFGAVPDMFDMP